MDYIVFDLEWNQCPYGKENEDPHLPFEIIEIGAVKLNSAKEIVDEFHQLIKPVVYNKLHFHTKEMIEITMEELQKGRSFPEAVGDFLEWCGKKAVFCTWGPLDLWELQRNLKFYQMKELLPGPIYFYDVQKLFPLAYEDVKERKSLSFAVEYLGLPEEGHFHRALEDARYTAMVLSKIPDSVIWSNCSVDSYQNPKTREDEIHILYADHETYISREFISKEAAMQDKEVSSLRCCYCHKNARKKIRWFASNAKIHIALGYCSRHGYMRGKIRMKKTEDALFYVIKSVKAVSEEDAKFIREKQIEIRQKRQKRRRKKAEEK